MSVSNERLAAWIGALSDRLILVYISHAARIVKVPGQPNARKAGQRAE